MNTYDEFAKIYDRLMKCDIDYEKWADYIENIFLKYDKSPKLIADLACGTGNITIPMSKRGYEMIGVDVSSSMLEIAREKALEQQLDILFLNQDISKLDLFGTCDAFLCMIDGLNYIISPMKLLSLFKKIKTCFIEPDGIFIFDISSKYKLSHILGNNTFIHNEEDIFYSWENRYIKRHDLSSMYLNFFKKEKNGLYNRFEEMHIQKAYDKKEMIFALKKSGFNHVDVYDEMSFDKPCDTSQRLVFVAR